MTKPTPTTIEFVILSMFCFVVCATATKIVAGTGSISSSCSRTHNLIGDVTREWNETKGKWSKILDRMNRTTPNGGWCRSWRVIRIKKQINLWGPFNRGKNQRNLSEIKQASNNPPKRRKATIPYHHNTHSIHRFRAGYDSIAPGCTVDSNEVVAFHTGFSSHWNGNQYYSYLYLSRF